MSEQNQIVEVITSSNVEMSTALTLQNAFVPIFEQAQQMECMAKSIVVTDATQLRAMKEARDMRLALQKMRVSADKKREELKKDSLNYSKAVQSVYNLIECFIKPLEQHLEKQEKFAENAEKERQANLRIERGNILAEYVQFLPPMGDLGIMNETEFERLLSIAKIQKQQHEVKLAQEEIERLERIEAERKREEEREAENKRLRAEIEQADKERKEAEEKARIAREESEKALKAEREAREAIERKAKEQADKERKEAEEKELQEQKAKNAPDVEKLMMFALMIDGLALPEVTGEEAKKIVNSTSDLLAKVSAFIREKSKNI